MIPKKIHWIWFGKKPLTDKMKACLESWKIHLPEYEIIKWNEDNFDFSQTPYGKAAFEAGYYAHASDIARLIILLKNGGWYFDTDVEILQPLDSFLNNKALFSFRNYSNFLSVSSAFLASEKGNPIIANIIKNSEAEGFVELADGVYKNISNFIVQELKNFGMELNNKQQCTEQFSIYPYQVFNPLVTKDKELEIDKNTYAIHHYETSWCSPELKQKYINLDPKLKWWGKDGE